MVNTKFIKYVLGLALMFIGIFFMLLDRYVCRISNGAANNEEFILCIKLFMFVGIIFIVCGAVLLIKANTFSDLEVV